MKWGLFLSLLSILFLGSCQEKQVTEIEETSSIRIEKTRRIEPDIQIPSSIEPGTTDFQTIQEKADMTDDVDEFVAWLKTRTNVSNVVQTKLMYLTSNPPKQVVSFRLNDINHRLIFTIDTKKTFTFL